MYAVKRRMLDEVEGAFLDHPAFSEKVKVYHKFPYQERVQYGVVLRGTSASQLRMSADNYLAEDISMVRLAREAGRGDPSLDPSSVGYTHPGIAIEWARENAAAITEVVTEDVSGQLSPTQRMFRTIAPILAGPGNPDFADSVGQVKVTLNGVPQLPEYVNGPRGVVMLRRAPAAGSIVVISYYARRIAPPGIYVFDFIEDNQFLIAPIYLVKSEEVISRTTGTENTVNLGHQNVDPSSETLTLWIPNNDIPVRLVRGTNYSIDYVTGEVTFLTSLPTGQMLRADYRWQPTNYMNGPYTFDTYQENHEVIPGAVVAIGRRAKKGDRQVVIISPKREPQARIYGGHWTMSMDFSVISKDPVQMEEMSDQLINWLWAVRKNVLEFEGLTLNSVEPSGESEESFMETTGDVYYTMGISVSIQTEWQRFEPYLYEIRDIVPDLQLWPGIKNYTVSKDFQLEVAPLQADARPVMKYPIVGYERLA